MKRGLVFLLACALAALGQRNPAPVDAARDQWAVDAVAVDASGHAVTDLTAGDFEIAQGGRARTVTNVTWFDTRSHTSVSRGGQAQLPALDLLPDEIRRNVVAIVDDLGLTAAGIAAVRNLLGAFARGAMSPGDRLAVVRNSGGSGVLQQLTVAPRTLAGAIDKIHYLGGSTNAAAAGSATWLALGYALGGLRDVPGRKVVVVFSENPGAPGPRDGAISETAHAAHAAGAAVYGLNPRSAESGAASAGPSALAMLARDTGGAMGGDFAQVLASEQGYYAIGFQPEDNSIDATGRWSPAAPVQLKVRRPGVVLRWRAGFLRQTPRTEFPAPLEHSELLENALASPFGGSDIRTRLTALFSDYAAAGPQVDAMVHVDLKGFFFIHDLQDMYRGEVQLRLAAYTDDGRSTTPMRTANKFAMRPVEYRLAMENGLLVSFRLKLPGPGAWQIRAVAADGGSDRMGSATQFVHIPNVRQGEMALSGLTLRGGSVASDAAPGDPGEDAGVRIFKAGRSYTFLYTIFNPLSGPDKQSVLEVQTRIFADGRLLYDGKPGRVSFGETPEGTRRQITGQLKLDSQMTPGDYVLQVTARDTLAPAGQTRSATQFIDFQVRE